VTRLVQLVADYGPGDLAYAETVQRVALVAPDAQLLATLVAPADTLAAGLCVAQLALGGGPGDRVVVHDVAGAAGDSRLWIGRTRDGALVVGADRGWAWSFVAPGLSELCALDVPCDAEVALAVRHATANHPHAVVAVIGRERVPPPPDCVLVWTDRAGNLQTTLAAAPVERVSVRIGDRREAARVSDGAHAPAAGELVLEPGARGLRRLALGGGSAADRFDAPAAGTPVEVTVTPDADEAPRGRRRPSRRAAPRRA
jgi:hypothetical protein